MGDSVPHFKELWTRSRVAAPFHFLLEGINSLVQASKRKARGYHKVDNFIAMIYATANKLEIKVEPIGLG